MIHLSEAREVICLRAARHVEMRDVNVAYQLIIIIISISTDQVAQKCGYMTAFAKITIGP